MKLLHDSGLEIDQLDESTYALRTIPQCFDTFNIRETLSDLINFFQIQKIEKFSFKNILIDSITTIKLKDFFLSEKSIFLVIDETSIIQLLEQKCLIALDSQNLAKLFK